MMFSVCKIYEMVNNVENIVEQQINGGENLEQRFGQQILQRVKFFFCVRYVFNFVFGVVDVFGDGVGEL